MGVGLAGAFGEGEELGPASGRSQPQPLVAANRLQQGDVAAEHDGRVVLLVEQIVLGVVVPCRQEMRLAQGGQRGRGGGDEFMHQVGQKGDDLHGQARQLPLEKFEGMVAQGAGPCGDKVAHGRDGGLEVGIVLHGLVGGY